jgi:hypothetical protein
VDHVHDPGEPSATSRSLLLLLALINAVVGGFAFLAPHAFYRHVLGVDKLGPYDQHLVSDVGGFYLGFALLLFWAARSRERSLARAGAGAFLLAQALHFGFHLFHLSRFTAAEAIGQTLELSVFLVLPLLILFLTRRRGQSG